MLHFLTVDFLVLHFLIVDFVMLHFLTVDFLSLHFLTVDFLIFHFLTVDFLVLHFLTVDFLLFHFLTVASLTLHLLTADFLFFHFLTVDFHTAQASRCATLAKTPGEAPRRLLGACWERLSGGSQEPPGSLLGEASGNLLGEASRRLLRACWEALGSLLEEGSQEAPRSLLGASWERLLGTCWQRLPGGKSCRAGRVEVQLSRISPSSQGSDFRIARYCRHLTSSFGRMLRTAFRVFVECSERLLADWPFYLVPSVPTFVSPGTVGT